MKKYWLKYLLAMFILICAAATTQAQTRIYVKARPSLVVTTRTASPHAGYVWVDDEWTVRNGTYVQVAGHWVAPRAGYVWVPGHWVTTRSGDYWVRGHWRRV